MTIKKVTLESSQIDGYKIQNVARQHTLYVDQPVAAGGTDSGPTPLEYLFISLAGCIITIGHIVVNQRRLPVRKIEVSVEGDIDTDVFLGKTKEGRAGFTGIQVRVKIDADMSLQEKEQFLRDVDARCPISDNIHNATPIAFKVEE